MLPVVLVEARVLAWMVDIRLRQAFKLMLFANVWTTLLGLPLSNALTWVIDALAASVLPPISLETWKAHGPFLKAFLRNHWLDEFRLYEAVRVEGQRFLPRRN